MGLFIGFRYFFLYRAQVSEEPREGIGVHLYITTATRTKRTFSKKTEASHDTRAARIFWNFRRVNDGGGTPLTTKKASECSYFWCCNVTVLHTYAVGSSIGLHVQRPRQSVSGQGVELLKQPLPEGTENLLKQQPPPGGVSLR